VIAEGPVTFRLQELVSRGQIQPDEHQLLAARELDRVYHDLMTHDPPPLANLVPTTSSNTTTSVATTSSTWFGSFFGKATETVVEAATATLGIKPTITGVYTYGGVGCGKTFLMDILYHSIDHGPWESDKQMVHYHKFMLNVHQFMHQSRKEQKEDLIGPVVHHILEQGRLLCLDEFQVTDVADAMILKELFQRLWRQGCVLITTSNRPPKDLYLRGLQRERFVPFIHSLERQCHVVSLMDNETDYRMMMSMQDDAMDMAAVIDNDNADDNNGSTPLKRTARPKQVYFCGKEHQKQIQRMFREMTTGRPTNPTTLETQGRKVTIPMACQSKSVCMFSFEDLCQKALGAADYLVIGKQFSTVFLYGIPQLSVDQLNWLRRFIIFVDTMYELRVRLLLQTTAGSIDEIFVVEGEKKSYTQDEVFAFDRTLSRLNEMSTAQYLSSKWVGDKDDTAQADVTSTLAVEPT
jgi:predicted ATPase